MREKFSPLVGKNEIYITGIHMLASTQFDSQRDYLVLIETASDLLNTIQRSVAVTWDDGVEIDWVNWLDCYNQFECQKFKIVEIS